MKQLIKAAVPEQPDASYERSDPAASVVRFVSWNRWRSRGETFILKATVSRWDDRWIGEFNLTRGEAVEVLEEWVLDDGSALNVIEAGVLELSDDERTFSFSYLSDCMIPDTECLDDESRRLWPRLRATAERDEATVVFLTAQDCTSASVTAFAQRDAGGEWNVGW